MLACGATPLMVVVVENSNSPPLPAYVVASTWLPAVVLVGVGAVAVVVVGAAVGGQVPVADELVVAAPVGDVDGGVRRVAHAQVVARAERVRVVVAVGADVGEGGVGGVQAAVEDADEHALTLGADLTGDLAAVPDGGGADPLGTDVGLELALLVDVHRGDAVEVGDATRLGAGQPDREAVGRLGVGVGDPRRGAGDPADRGAQVVLLVHERGAVARGRGDALGVGAALCGLPGGDGGLVELDDVGLDLAGLARLAEGQHGALLGLGAGEGLLGRDDGLVGPRGFGSGGGGRDGGGERDEQCGSREGCHGASDQEDAPEERNPRAGRGSRRKVKCEPSCPCFLSHP